MTGLPGRAATRRAAIAAARLQLLALIAVTAAWAAGGTPDYPTRPIELVVPFVAGGTTDTIARLIAQRLSDRWGQPAIVLDRPGAGGEVGTNIVAKAAPDGTTLLVTTIAFAINAAMHKAPDDQLKSFTPITELASIPLMLVVHPSVPATNVNELIAYSKAQPAGLDYASSGTGTSTHLAAEMFKAMTGANLVHVPFKGNAEVLTALLGGHVKVYFGLVASALEHVRSGRLRVLAVTMEKRLAVLPDVPTIAELGWPGYEISSWQAMLAPAGTPADIIAKISDETSRMLAEPDIRERIRREGADPVGSSPAQFDARIRSEIEKWTKVVKASGLATQ